MKIGVVFGGDSVEHEVSVISALQAIDNINKDKYDVIPIYIDKNKKWFTGNELFEISNYKDVNKLIEKCEEVSLKKMGNDFYLIKIGKVMVKRIAKVDLIFPIVHGSNLEDGTLTGYFKTLGIPCVFSNLLGSALGQDKVILKQVLENNNIPVASYTWFYDYEYLDSKKECLNKIAKLGYPVVVKPATLGSSVGISYAKNEDEVIEAIEKAIMYDKKIIVEEAINNLMELNCSVLGNYKEARASVIEEVRGNNEILTYEDKYLKKGKGKKQYSKGMVSTDRIIPAKIDKELTQKIKECSIKAFKVLNLTGVCRIDYLVDEKTNRFYLNEPNTIPGSLSFYLWEESGLKYCDLLDELISTAIIDYKQSLGKIKTFDKNILETFSFKNTK